MTSGASRRMRALMAKETAELRASPLVLMTPLLMLLTAVAMPLVLAVGVPAWSGEALGDAGDLVAMARQLAPVAPDLATLAPEAAVQALILLQFLPLLVLVPVLGAMTLVTTSVVGEKQARSLEPLLATPVTTAELLAGKTAVALLVSVGMLTAGYAALVLAAAVVAQPGVAATLVTARAAALVAGVAPAIAAITLVLGVMASSRAKDARTAQQFGAIVVLPIVVLFVGQLSGGLLLDTTTLLAASAVLWLTAAGLGALAVLVFDREHILTKWT